MKKKTYIGWMKKALSVAVIFVLVASGFRPIQALAEDPATGSAQTETVTPTDAPTPTPTPGTTEVTNDTTTTTDTVSSTANTGANEVITPTPTPESTPDLTAPSPASGSGEPATESAFLNIPESTDSASTSAPNTTPGGDHNDGGSSSGGNSGQQNATTATGDAVSITTVDNEVNTTSINAATVRQTINVFVPLSAPIDLSLAAMEATAQVLAGPQANNDTVNVGITVNNSVVSIDNTIASRAISGQNTAAGTDASVTSGNAASVVSLLNSVNTTVINSTIHIYTINIFAVDEGSIILPELTAANGSGCCGTNVSVTNSDTTVTNTVTSLADSGNNTIQGSGTIQTGDAVSTVNVTTLANTTITNSAFYQLFINVFGTWSGQFRGWGTLTAEDGGASLSLFGVVPDASGSADCGCANDVTVNNSSVSVRNTVTSEAVTGGNTASGKDTAVTTGNAYSAVNIINLINSTFINSRGFFAFINIFGILKGDVGGASTFAAKTDDTNIPAPSSENTVTASQSEENRPHEEGGELAITNTNNVAAYVLPGDTVTFFVNARNTGSGIVYDSGIDLYLVNADGDSVGGRHYSVGNIDVGKGVKLTTGFVLSPNTPPGPYTARAVITGHVGPDDRTVSTQADSTFLVYGSVLSPALEETNTAATPPAIPRVLGMATRAPGDTPNILLALAVLLLLLPAYGSLRILKDPARLKIIFEPERPFAYRFRAIMTLML